MVSSAFLRRWISKSAANRLMSTATSGGVPPPWLMLPPAIDESGKIGCLATKQDFTHTTNASRELAADDIDFVGSSHGWLALFNWRSSDLFLTNPITDRHLNLRSFGCADRLILTSSPIEEGALAFLTFGSRHSRVALCRASAGGEWSLFGGDHNYDNLVYSARSNRVFTICEKYDAEERKKQTSLEAWDVGGSKPCSYKHAARTGVWIRIVGFL